MEIKDGQGTTKATEVQGQDVLNRFFEEQLQVWPDAQQRFNDLKGVLLKAVRRHAILRAMQSCAPCFHWRKD